MRHQYKYLSHLLTNDTPTYGNEYHISVTLTNDIRHGAIANESHISTTTHIGTHIDLPYHFFEMGQTIEAYDASFWIFKNPLIVEINSEKDIIKDELVTVLEETKDKKEIDIIIVKTGIEKLRGSKKFWAENPGFDPSLYSYLVATFPKLRAFGFDSISLSSYKHPAIGRRAHQAFLNPKHPMIVIEDMHLSELTGAENISQIIIAPLRIAKCDGMPCTIIASCQ